jgi:hypothetical protein
MLNASSISALLSAISAEQTWAVVLVLVGLLVSVGGFAFRQLWTQLQGERAKNAKLEDRAEAERHASVMRGMDTLTNETRGIRNELHTVNDRVGKVERRVDSIERTIKPEGHR